jgi:hypothetical protein
MNFKQGFLRIWVLVSVLWLALAGFFFVDAIQSVYAPVTIQVGEYPVQFPGNTSRNEVHEAVVKFLKEKTAGTQFANAAVNYSGAANEVIGNYQSKSLSDPIIRFLKFGIGPPLALLVLGVAVWWVASGFRQSPT